MILDDAFGFWCTLDLQDLLHLAGGQPVGPAVAAPVELLALKRLPLCPVGCLLGRHVVPLPGCRVVDADVAKLHRPRGDETELMSLGESFAGFVSWVLGAFRVIRGLGEGFAGFAGSSYGHFGFFSRPSGA